MLLLALTTCGHRRQAAEDTALVQAFGELESHAAVAHLWLEEHVTGDQVDLGEIERRLDRSVRPGAPP